MNLRKHFWKMRYNSDFSRHVTSYVEQTTGTSITARGTPADKAECLEWYESLLRLVEQIGKGKVALDVGCGHGYVAGHLRTKGVEAFALDIDPTVLKENSIKGYFIKGDAMHLPIKNYALDLVVTFEVVEHLKNPDVALREFHRCLKSGGILLLTTPTPKSSAANYPGHVSIRSRKAWVKTLESVGFKPKIVTYKYPVHVFPSKMLNHLIGVLLGLYKRYFSVTSTKLLCMKK